MSLSPEARRIRALRSFATSITVLTVLGHVWLGFEQSYITPIAAVIVACSLNFLLEVLDGWAQGQKPRFAGSYYNLLDFLLPAYIASLACALLLYGNKSLWPTIFAVTVAICSKYIIRIKINGQSRHVFNPSNFGIAVTLLLFSWVSWAPPYQYTANFQGVFDWLIPQMMLVAGFALNYFLTGRSPLILAWFLGFLAQGLLRSVFLDQSFIAAILPVTGLSFILFTNYMITDPGTTPYDTKGQILFGLVTAAIYGILVALNITYGLFFALVIVCGGRALLVTVQQLVKIPLNADRSAYQSPAKIP